MKNTNENGGFQIGSKLLTLITLDRTVFRYSELGSSTGQNIGSFGTTSICSRHLETFLFCCKVEFLLSSFWMCLPERDNKIEDACFVVVFSLRIALLGIATFLES